MPVYKDYGDKYQYISPRQKQKKNIWEI